MLGNRLYIIIDDKSVVEWPQNNTLAFNAIAMLLMWTWMVVVVVGGALGSVVSQYDRPCTIGTLSS